MRHLLVLALFASIASGQSLTPDRFHTTPSQPITLSYPSPTASEFPAAPAWFFVRLAGTQENRDATNATAPSPDGTLALPLPLAGVALIGLDLPTETSEWDAQTFTTFAQSAGRHDLCPTTPSTVEHRISAATIVRISNEANSAGNAPSDPTATSKAGLAAEIRPLMDPSALGVGSDLPIRIYIDGDAVAAARVSATHEATGTIINAATDSKGIATVRIDHAGKWTIRFHTITELTAEKDPHPVWRATSGSLTFAASTPATADKEISQ